MVKLQLSDKFGVWCVTFRQLSLLPSSFG